MNESNPARLGDVYELHYSQWGLHLHESCQYNFFCDDKFFCVRQIELRDFRHQSAWLYDGKVCRSSQPQRQNRTYWRHPSKN